jgi:hypothetical protein
MKIRKFGTDGPWLDVEGDPCAFCEAARHCNWPDSGGVLFLENEAGAVHRVEMPAEAAELGLLAFLCGEVTPDEARREIASEAQS